MADQMSLDFGPYHIFQNLKFNLIFFLVVLHIFFCFEYLFQYLSFLHCEIFSKGLSYNLYCTFSKFAIHKWSTAFCCCFFLFMSLLDRDGLVQNLFCKPFYHAPSMPHWCHRRHAAHEKAPSEGPAETPPYQGF